MERQSDPISGASPSTCPERLLFLFDEGYYSILPSVRYLQRLFAESVADSSEEVLDHRLKLGMSPISDGMTPRVVLQESYVLQSGKRHVM